MEVIAVAKRTPSFTPLVALAVAIFSGAYFTLTHGKMPQVSIPGVTTQGGATQTGGSQPSSWWPNSSNNAAPVDHDQEITASTTMSATPVTGGRSEISVFFSPKGGCTDACVREIQAARQVILVQAYSFTSAPIAKALTEAHSRGVKVTVVLDKSQKGEKYTEADFVLHAGIPTYIDEKHAIAHNKIMLIDGRTIITGSFNFTSAAENSNAENLLIMHDMPQLFAAYQQNFQTHLGHSVQYEGK